MADGTKIEWADATVNAINGCSVTSPGCTHCYAMKLAGTRMKSHPTREGLTIDTKAGPVWNGEVRLHQPALLQPLSWSKPRRIFWNAHGDTFHPNVPWEWTAKVMATAFLSPQHIHMILTKRADRMNAWFETLATEGGAEDFSAIIEDLAESAGIECDYPEWVLPLDNVWLGVSVEDQTRADERIPDLLATPAAVRFLSCEPLLGEVDINRWLATANVTCKVCNTPFWLHEADPCEHAEAGAWTLACPGCGNCRCQPGWSPAGDRGRPMEPPADWIERKAGRFSLVHPTIPITSGIDWVIVGGESGPGARPMHPDWARSLRDQCAAAGVPFHFKQWGEWISVYDRDRDDPEWNQVPKPGDWDRKRWLNLAGGQGFHGEKLNMMRKVGKKRAGRLLDGVEHNGMPQVHHD